MRKPSVPARPAASRVEAAAAKSASTEELAAAESTSASEAPGSSAGRRPRPNRRILVTLLGLLVMVGVVGALILPQFFASAPTQTTWQAITSGITNGTVNKQTALEAFAYIYKVNIPGVTVPSGRDGGDAPTSGTGAMDWVQANWSQLTPDQQAVIDAYTTPGPNDQTISISPAPTAATSGSVAKPQFQLTAARNVGPVTVQLAPKAPLTIAEAMTNELYADIARIGPKLGMPVLTVGSSLFPNITLDLSLSLKDGGNALMTTYEVDTTYGIKSATVTLHSPCNVTVWKNGWDNENVTSSGGVSPTLHVLLTHEVVHCYQDVVWGSKAVKDIIPAWIKEGTAMYLAADDTGVEEPFMAGMWNTYFIPQFSLTNRTYDAYGYFALLAHNGRDLWSLMLPAWQAAAAAASSEPSTAFIAVLQGDAADVRNNWAESYLRQPDWGDPWIAYGFGLPDAAQVNQHPAQAQPDPGWTGSLNGRSNIVLNVNATSGEVVTVTTDGLASVHDNSGNSDVAFGSERFCTVSGGCVCPEGTLEAGKDMASKQLTIPFVAAFNAGADGSRYSIVGAKLDDLCKRPATPEPSAQPQASSPKGPCGSNCGGSNGDPHLTTINKAHYEFQAAGEFTLLRSADGSLEIQVRQEPYGPTGTVSTNTAIAAKVGSHRVDVYASGGALTAWVDGAAVDLISPMDLGNGGRISTYTKGFEIDFPDGTKLWTLSVGRYGINAQVSPSAALSASGTGLLAAAAPGGLGLPALPNGTQLPTATDRHSLHNIVYGQYADAWRVTDSTTLFDYGPGLSTATYTNRNYPAESADISLADLTADQLAKGNAACAAITDSSLRDECVFDVGVTSDAGFADSYKATQSFYNSGQTSNASISPGAPTPAASGSVSGAIQVVQGTNLGGFGIGPNDMVYILELVSPTQSSLLEVNPKTSSIVGRVDVPVAIHQLAVPASTEVKVAAGSVWLPGITTDGNSCTVTRLDSATLAEQATIAIPCGHFGPETISDGSALWVVDVTKYDVGSNKGAVLARIDPTTNALGTSVALPFINGNRIDSQGALFYQDAGISNLGYYRLPTGASAFEPFGLGAAQNPAIPAGNGLWIMSDDGHSAQYFTSPGTPQAMPQITLPIPGKLVGGDATAAYVEIKGKDPTGTKDAGQLWRYPIDGSAPTVIAYSPTVSGGTYFYSTASTPGPITNPDGVLTIWSAPVGGSKTPTVFLQWVPTR